MQRYILFAIFIVTGLAGGLYFGWVLNPVQVGDTSPEILRLDFQSDYVLMVAEIYQSEQNPELAIQRLDFLGAANPLEKTTQALDFARRANFASPDILLLEQLDAALRAWDPSLEFTPTPE